MGEFGRASKQPRACHCRMTVGPNENGPDVKLGGTRQGRTFRPAFGKAGRGQSRPKLMANSLRLTVSGSSICRASRQERADDQLALALFPAMASVACRAALRAVVANVAPEKGRAQQIQYCRRASTAANAAPPAPRQPRRRGRGCARPRDQAGMLRKEVPRRGGGAGGRTRRHDGRDRGGAGHDDYDPRFST